MEEIDIIELLQRVKEGIAPKKIEIEGNIFYLDEDEATSYQNIDTLYSYHNNRVNFYWSDIDLYLNTKIKILDKPIIEEFKISEEHTGELYMDYPSKDEIIGKINEIIRHINKEEK